MVASITSKWQLVLPKAVRERLGVHPGDKLDFIIQDDGKVLVQPASLPVSSLKGIVPRPAAPVSLDAMNAVVRRRARSGR